MKSWVEIDGAKLSANYAAIRRVAGEDVETMAVIKANAYGHDAVLCARVLVAAGARWLGVADLEEAVRLRRERELAGTRILLMSGIEPADAPAILAHKLTPVVWTPAHLDALESAARSAQTQLPVHLEIDTGMARQGTAPGAELEVVLSRLAVSRWLLLEGLMTHLACAEVAHSRHTAAQRERFAAAFDQVRAAGLRPELLHIGNSSAVDEGSTMQWLRDTAARHGIQSMVRAGISLYGYTLPIADSRDEQGEGIRGRLAPALQPVLTWKTRILEVHSVPVGSAVGYSATFTAPHAMRVALLPVGYSDGFRRAASSGAPPAWQRGWVMIAGKRASVLGRVSMNLTVVDVTAIDGVQAGDEVVLLGEGVTADDHAAWAGTISYEILCGIRAHPVLA